MSTTKAITKSCIGSIKFIGGLLCLLWLLTACTSGAEQGSESPPMKFPVAGGDALLRAIDADSIRATYTWRLIDQPLGTEPVMMTRVGDTNQWQTPQITIPLNTGFIFQISWTAPDIEGYRIQYALQSFRSADGIDSDQVIDISEQNPRFDTFDDDADGVNNYQELLAGTPATVLTEGSTSEGNTTEGNATEGSATEGNATEGNATEGNTPEGNTPEGNMPEGNMPEGNTPEGNATEGNTPEGGTTDGSAGGDAVVPSGGIVGAWYGSNNFGEGVMIIDANQNLFSFAANGSGVYETVLGPVSGNLERFFHRDSVNVAFADSFSLVGDRPSATNSVFSDTADYNLTVQNDGQQIVHTGAGGDFIMTFATENDLAPISIDSIAGSWIAKSSFCPESCNITLEVTISATGAIFGSTQFNENPALTLAGDVSVAPGSSQHLNVLFSWGELVRVGAIHFDRRDPTRIIINTFGPDSGFAGSASFAASLIRR